ncbi:hypothetical protein Tco_0184994 [Tanacetum coccineum]
MRTKTELTLEKTQQGASDEVLNIRVIPYSIHNDDGNPTSANIKQALRQIKLFGVLENSLLINTSTDFFYINFQSYVHGQPHKVTRTARAAAKPCQGDSFEFYLITGIASLSTSVMKKGFLKTFPFPTHLNKMVLLKGKNRTLIEAARTMLSGLLYGDLGVFISSCLVRRVKVVGRLAGAILLKSCLLIFLNLCFYLSNDDNSSDNSQNTKDIQISEHSSSPSIEDTSVHNTIPILNPFLSIPSMTHGSRIQEEVFGVNNRLSKRRQSRGEKVKNCRGQQGFLVANHLEFYYFWFVMDVLISAANVPCCSQFNQ